MMPSTSVRRLSLINGFSVISVYPSSKLRTRNGMLCIVLSSVSPLQHPLFPWGFLEVFISGILLSLFVTSIFDHSLESFFNQLGPFHHKEHPAKPEGVAALVHRSAGFSLVETCCNCDGSVNICISPIRFATKGWNSLPRP